MHALQRALETLVRRDRAPAHLDGVIIVAVKGPKGTSFWHAAFAGDRVLGTGYLEGLPRDADAILLFNETQATDALEGRMPAGKVATYGSHQLLDAFIARYCTFRSFVGVRAGS